MVELEIERIPVTCTLDCGSRCELVACVRAGRLLRLDTPPNRADTIERPRLIPCARGRAHRGCSARPSGSPSRYVAWGRAARDVLRPSRGMRRWMRSLAVARCAGSLWLAGCDARQRRGIHLGAWFLRGDGLAAFFLLLGAGDGGFGQREQL